MSRKHHFNGHPATTTTKDNAMDATTAATDVQTAHNVPTGLNDNFSQEAPAPAPESPKTEFDKSLLEVVDSQLISASDTEDEEARKIVALTESLDTRAARVMDKLCDVIVERTGGFLSEIVRLSHRGEYLTQLLLIDVRSPAPAGENSIREYLDALNDHLNARDTFSTGSCENTLASTAESVVKRCEKLALQAVSEDAKVAGDARPRREIELLELEKTRRYVQWLPKAKRGRKSKKATPRRSRYIAGAIVTVARILNS